MIRCTRMAVLLAVVLASGCDDTPAIPPDLVLDAPVSPEAQPARPTTQELLEGPRHPVPLGELPLTVQAPAGWEVEPLAGTSHVLLQGPTPFGEAAVQLNDRPLTTGAKFEMIVNGAKKELEQFPQSIKMVELRQIEGAQVLERQRVGLMPAPSPYDPPGVKLSPPLNWTITVFVPRGEDYDTYELNFIGLTADQYDADETLLRGIMDSITVNAASAAGGSGATTAPAPPAP